jgi:predicted patatin/cPLA2 family phospholipase
MKLITHFLVMLSIVLCGCGAPRPAKPPKALTCELSKYTVDDIYDDWRLYNKGLNIKQPPSFNILSLSAGGQFGAYGAGFLYGWSKVTENPKPGSRKDIQVVTGVSTGAILATHAFLEKDEEIMNKYKTLSGEQIYRSRGLLEYIRANSFFNTSGKDQMISENLTSEIIDEVADKFDKGRFLYIGIVNLDTGKFDQINMVKLAHDLQPNERRDQCYRAVIGASSAIPIAFSPKFIDDKMWVDGGARRHLFFTYPSTEAKKLGVTRRLYSIIHGDLSVGEERVKNGVLQIAGRTAELFIDQGLKESIRLQDQIASKCPSEINCGPSNKLFETYYAAAFSAAVSCKDELEKCKKTGGITSDDVFCNPFMKCLAERGEIDGRAFAKTGNWLSIDDLCLGSNPDCEPSQKFKRGFSQ